MRLLILYKQRVCFKDFWPYRYGFKRTLFSTLKEYKHTKRWKLPLTASNQLKAILKNVTLWFIFPHCFTISSNKSDFDLRPQGIYLFREFWNLIPLLFTFLSDFSETQLSLRTDKVPWDQRHILPRILQFWSLLRKAWLRAYRCLYKNI